MRAAENPTEGPTLQAGGLRGADRATRASMKGGGSAAGSFGMSSDRAGRRAAMAEAAFLSARGGVLSGSGDEAGAQAAEAQEMAQREVTKLQHVAQARRVEMQRQESEARAAAPRDADLAAYLAAHADRCFMFTDVPGQFLWYWIPGTDGTLVGDARFERLMRDMQTSAQGARATAARSNRR